MPRELSASGRQCRSRRRADRAAARVPAAAAEEPPTEAERAIDVAIRKIAKLQSVAANVEQDVDMLNQKFKVTGATQGAEYAALPLARNRRGLPDSSGQFSAGLRWRDALGLLSSSSISRSTAS